MSDWPVAEPGGWVNTVNRPQSQVELEGLRRSVRRGQPYGGEEWSQRVAHFMGLESTFRARGRPAKKSDPSHLGKGS